MTPSQKSMDLEQLIHQSVVFTKTNAYGFNSLKCPLCSDYKDRLGIKFTPDSIVANCFNCGYAGVHNKSDHTISNNFKKLLVGLGVDSQELNAAVSSLFFVQKKEESVIKLSTLQKVNTATPVSKLPPQCFKLGETDQFIEYQQKLVDYLMNRKIDILQYPFYFSLDRRFINRVIIPFYRGGQLIYWQARSIDPSEKKRYDNSPESKNAVFFNFDQLNTYSRLPLFVTEGPFDAMMVNGVALIGSKLNDAKRELLHNSKRRKVFVIDKDANGRHLAEEVLSQGWEISFSPEGTTDLNNSAQRFGLAWTVYSVMNSIPCDNDVARLAINLNCKGK